MTDEKNTTIIEINGIKLEVDLSSAKRVQTIQVGTRVKLLSKSDYGTPKVHSGVVVGFEPFESLPTIVVAYVKTGYASSPEIEFIAINENTDDYELVAALDDDALFERADVMRRFAIERERLEGELQKLTERETYFQQNFQQYWKPVETGGDS